MKDIASRPLKVGDWVVVARRNVGLAGKPSLTIARIISEPFEDGRCQIEMQNPGPSMRSDPLEHPCDMVRIEEEDALVARLSNRR